MPASVPLQEIIDALQMESEEATTYLDPETGELHQISHYLRRFAEEDDEPDHLPQWQEREWEAAQKLVKTGQFLRLPTQWDIHEWVSVRSQPVQDDLLSAIHGKGAFRYFKDMLRRHRIEDQWFDHRAQAFRQIAIDWCESNKIPWHEGQRNDRPQPQA